MHCARHLNNPRYLSAALAASALGLVIVGWLIGEWQHLNPCPLCIFQRLLYLIFAGLACCAALTSKPGKICSGLLCGVALGGLVSALYQSVLQWEQAQLTAGTAALLSTVQTCGLGAPNLIEQLVEWLGGLWPAMFMATGFCTDKAWVLLGLSMANWSLLCFAALLAGALQLLRQTRNLAKTS